MDKTSAEVSLVEINERLRSLAELAPTAEDESRRWSTLIYILVHHPKCHRLDELIDCNAKSINRDDLNKKMSLQKWSFAERYLIELALYLYDLRDLKLHLGLPEGLFLLSDTLMQIATNAVGIRLGTSNFEDVLLRDLAS